MDIQRESLLQPVLAAGARVLAAIPWAVLVCAGVARILPDISPRRWLSNILLAVLGLALLVLLPRLLRVPRRGAWVGLVLGWVTALPAGLWLWIDPFGARRLYDPGDCVVPLRTTERCRGTDDSFTECRYRFRAEGEPRPARCRAFLAAPTGAASADLGCDYEQPSAWERVPCGARDLPATMACFACESREHERVRRYLDAFALDCGHEVVLAACNMNLE